MRALPWPFVLALAGLGIAGPSCKTDCDDDLLRRTAAAFDARLDERRSTGFVVLWQACPSIPIELARSLAVEFDPDHALEGEALERHHAERVSDPQWRMLLHRTCPGIQTDPFEVDDPQALRRACTLDPALLDANDVFVPRDATALVLYDWLLSVRVPPPLARDVVRPLLAASATAEELEAMCWSEGLTCDQVITPWELSLPEGSHAQPVVGEGPRITITPTVIALDQTPLVSLFEGCVSPSARTGRAIPSLRQRLAPLGQPDGIEPEARRLGITLFADRTTPTRTILDVMFTAAKEGFSSTSLVVGRGRRLGSITLHAPETWFPRTGVIHDRASVFALVLRRDAVSTGGSLHEPTVWPVLEGCTPSSRGCHDLQAIASAAESYATQHPHELGLSLRVEDDVPLETMLAVVDAVHRGYGCLGPTPPQGCVDPSLVLDGEPRLYERSDRDDSLVLVLDDARVEPWGSHLVSPKTERAALSAYARARDQIQRCLAEQPEVIGRLPDAGQLRVQYIRPPSGAGPMIGRVWPLTYDYDGEVDRCVLEPLGVTPDEGIGLRDFLARVRFELVIPTRFEPPS